MSTRSNGSSARRKVTYSLFEAHAERSGLRLVDDPGLLAVDAVYRALSVDEEWSDFQGRGFAWWGEDLMQHVWASEQVVSRGELITAVHAETVILQDITSDHAQDLIASMGPFPTLNAFIFDPQERTLKMRATVYVHEQNYEWLSKLFCLAAALQASEAQAKIDNGVAEIFGASPPAVVHPRSGRRRAADDMLYIGFDVAAAGRDPGRSYTVADLANAVGLLDGTDGTRFWTMAFVGTAAGEFVAVVAEEGEYVHDGNFGLQAENESFAAAIREAAEEHLVDASAFLRALWFKNKGTHSASVAASGSGDGSGRTALVQVLLRDPHPVYGHGALLRLDLPVFSDDGAGMRSLAAEMNRAESDTETWTGMHQLGRWCESPEGNLVHETFLPAYAKDETYLLNLMLSTAVLRVPWARRYLNERRLRGEGFKLHTQG